VLARNLLEFKTSSMEFEFNWSNLSSNFGDMLISINCIKRCIFFLGGQDVTE